MARASIRFSVYVNGKLIDEIEVDRPVFNIGKLSTSTLRLDDINVSRKHAVIERRDDGSWRITDLGSTNGTVLRGERVEQVTLADGDRLLIGRTTLVVHLAETAPAAARVIAGSSDDASNKQAPVVADPPRRSPPRPAPLPLAPPAPVPARAGRPRGVGGHVITAMGALFFLAGALLMPWQRFELAGFGVSAAETSLFGLLATLIGGSTLIASVAGIVTGRRHRAARYNLVAVLLTGAWIALAAASPAGDHLMRFEHANLGPGFLVAAWGVLVMLGGTGLVFGALPRWDASTSFLRILVARGDRALRDLVVYEPRTVSLDAEVVADDGAPLPRLPSFAVTREGDVTLTRAGGRPEHIAHGARGSLDVADVRIMYLFVKPLPGRRTVALAHWTEAAAFGMLAVLVTLAAGLYGILGLEQTASRWADPHEARSAKIEPLMSEDQPPEVVQVQVELPEPALAEPEVALDPGDKYGDEVADVEALGDANDEPQSDLVDKLDPRRDTPPELANLAPSERAEKARELAEQTALAQVFHDDNPVYADLMNMRPDVDTRLNVLAALDQRGSFIAGAVDPFGGTLTPGGGFPGGPAGPPGTPGGPAGPGGPDGPAITGLPHPKSEFKDPTFVDRPPKPWIDETPPRIRGEHDPKIIQQHIRRYLSGIKWCYQDRLQLDHKLAGQMTLSFTILPSGGIIDARTTNNTLGDPVLDQCVVNRMARWRFPAPSDGGTAEIDYRLILKGK